MCHYRGWPFRKHRDNGPSGSGSPWISPSSPDRWHNYSGKEHDHQEQRNFPNPRDGRNRSDRYSKSDHANSRYGVIASPDAQRFLQRPMRLSAGLR
jgi:hypothetical protein